MYEVIQIVGTIIISIGTIATLIKRFVVNVGTTVIEKLLMPNSKVMLNNYVNALSLAGLVFIVSIGFFITDTSLPASSAAFMFLLGLLVVIGFIGFILFSITYEFRLLREYTPIRYFINACNFVCYMLISIIAIMFYSSIFTQVENFYRGKDIDTFSDIFSVELPLDNLLMILLVLFLSAIGFNMLLVTRKRILLKKIFITEIDSKDLNGGMIILHSIQPDIQIVAPAAEFPKDLHIYPQYIYFVQSDRLLKYDMDRNKGRGSVTSGDPQATTLGKRSNRHR